MRFALKLLRLRWYLVLARWRRPVVIGFVFLSALVARRSVTIRCEGVILRWLSLYSRALVRCGRYSLVGVRLSEIALMLRLLWL